MSIVIKNAAGWAAMREAGRLASEVLDYLTPHIVAGATTADIDRLGHDYMVKVQGTVPATLGYGPQGYPPYPASLCTSLNNVVCHGIPNTKPLKKGDILNVDVTVIHKGWHGDNSRMFLIGETSVQAKRLCAITFDAMWKGIEQIEPGKKTGDVGFAIQRYVESNGFSVVREFCGHGVGEKFHEEPQILHYGQRNSGDLMRPGMIFTVEPMVNAGRREVKEWGNDGWTIVTKDHSLSAQWEHTVLVTETGYEVLTLSAGSPATPAWVKPSA